MNIFTILLFNLIGPAISFMSTPFIVKLHGISYANYVLISSLSATVAMVSSLKIEQLMPIRHENQHHMIYMAANKALKRNSLIVFCFVSLISITVDGNLYKSFFSALTVSSMVFSQGIFQINYYKMLSRGEIKKLNIFRIAQAVVLSSGQILFSSYQALYISEIISRLLTQIDPSNLKRSESLDINISHIINENKSTISNAVMGSALSGLSSTLPLYYFMQNTDVSIKSMYPLIEKMIHVPILLSSTFIGQYMYSIFLKSPKSVFKILTKVITLAIIISIMIFSAFIILKSSFLEMPIIGKIYFDKIYIILIIGFIFEGLNIINLQIELAKEAKGRYIIYEVVRFFLGITSIMIAVSLKNQTAFIITYCLVNALLLFKFFSKGRKYV